MPSTDYLPVATGGSANVVAQSTFAGSTWQQNGFIVGTAISAQANKIWRQTSMMAAAIATVVMNTINQNVPDDGNLPNLAAQIILAIQTLAQGVLTASGYGAAIAALNASQTVQDGEIAANTAAIAALPTSGFTRNDVTGSRAFNTTYTNTSGFGMIVTGYGNTVSSSVASVQAIINGDADFANTDGATTGSGVCGFSFAVPAGSTYEVVTDTLTGGRTGISGLGKWVETIVK